LRKEIIRVSAQEVEKEEVSEQDSVMEAVTGEEKAFMPEEKLATTESV